MKTEQIGTLISGVVEALSSTMRSSEVEEVRQFAGTLQRSQCESLKDYVRLTEQIDQTIAQSSSVDAKDIASLLSAMVEKLASFPGMTVKEFLKFVDKAIAAQETSAPIVLGKIERHLAGERGLLEGLEKTIKKMGAADVKAVLKKYEIQAESKVTQNREILVNFLKSKGNGAPTADANGHCDATQIPEKPDADPEVVELIVTEYRAVEKNLADVGFEEIRRRIGELKSFGQPVLCAAAREIGFTTFTGSASQIVNDLTNALIKQKRSLEQIGFI